MCFHFPGMKDLYGCMMLRCSCEYRYAHTRVDAWRSEDNLRCWPCLSPCLRQSFIVVLCFVLAKESSLPKIFLSLPSILVLKSLTYRLVCPAWFSEGSEDYNLRPHTFTTSTLSTRPFPQHLGSFRWLLKVRVLAKLLVLSVLLC